MILTVSLNPSVDHVLFVQKLLVNDTNRVKRVESDAGGKGVNVARVAAEMGAKAFATGFIGGGPGVFVKHVLDLQGVKHDFVQVRGDTRTNFCIEEECGGPPTTLNEPGPEISDKAFQRLREYCRDLSMNASWVCFGGSLPQGAPPDAFQILLQDCRRADCSTVLDSDGEPMRLGVRAGPTFVKPNVREASRLLRRTIESTDECITAAQEIESVLKANRLGREPIVVISRGSDGAVMASGGNAYVGQSPEVQVNSTIGSGDSLIGGMLAALETGKGLEEAFHWGLAAGAATAMTDGSEIARRPVFLELLPQVRVESRPG